MIVIFFFAAVVHQKLECLGNTTLLFPVIRKLFVYQDTRFGADVC